MKTFKKSLIRLSSTVVAVFMLSAVVLPAFNSGSASAAQLQSRKLTLSSSANGNVTTNVAGVAQNPGEGGNGQKAKHTFTFNIGTTGNVGSVLIQYCTTPIPGTTCTTPTGLTADTIDTATGFPTQTGFSTNNFTLDTTTAQPTGCNGGSAASRGNCILIKRGTAASETSGATINIGFGGTSGEYITNPTTDNQTFFVRLSTYSDTAYTTQVDRGTVASSTAQQIDITAKVQEKLNFSVGSTHVAPGGTCTALNDTGALALGDVDGVLDTATQYDAHSYFRLSTNAINGTSVYYSADTLKDGSNDINALSSEVTTAAGTEAFGLALNSGNANHSFAGGSTGLTAATGYDEGNGALGTAKFNFATASVTTPVAVASAAPGGVVVCDTGAVRYVGNIATNTPAGIYTTTVTYIAVPTY